MFRLCGLGVWVLAFDYCRGFGDLVYWFVLLTFVFEFRFVLDLDLFGSWLGLSGGCQVCVLNSLCVWVV